MYWRSALTDRRAGAGATISDVDSAELAVTGKSDENPVIRAPVNAKRRRCAAKAMVLRDMSLTAHFRNDGPIRPVCGAV